MATQKINNWKIEWNNKVIPAAVPGDITIDFYKAGLIANPYLAENYKESEWIQKTDFVYETDLVVNEEILNEEVVELVFEGIDLFAEVYVNGTLVGSPNNMFRKFTYSVKDLLKLGSNKLEVKMSSTINKMQTYDASKYFSIFNDYRLFLRKAQCHFGWDWAPKICGYGIWQDVYLSYHSAYQIEDVKVVADMYGNLTFFTEVGYNVKAKVKPDGTVVVPAAEYLDDYLRYVVTTKPGKDFKEVVVKETKVTGKKSFCNFVFENPELWWPVGYGEHPLYGYRVELIRGGKVHSVKEGRFGFRSVRLDETPVGDEILGFKFVVNDVPVFVKGSNWVPIECFTGVVEDEKYRKIIKLAKRNNSNTLRVWGGGIYEKDIFYNICDEEGMLVWQDIMLACADIPEDEPEFMENFLPEIEYQVKRLRNHPCLIYWCGGNEKTGSYGVCVSHGDFLVNNVLRGFILNLDSTRPYRSQSPYSYTDFGNETTSGESHYGSAETTINAGLDHYRDCVANKVVPFVSESAVMGPTSIECIKNMFPEEHWWPMDEMWDDRLMDNPYAAIRKSFASREYDFASELYGEPTSLEDFVPKGMMYHAEALKCESEYARGHKGVTQGFMNWMFSDIWPSCTWAIIDYNLEPKEAYYQLGRSYASKYVNFYQDGNKNTVMFAVNDSNDKFTTKVTVYEKEYSGAIVRKEEVSIDNLGNDKAFNKVIGEVSKEHYLVAEYEVNGEGVKSLYSPDFYAHKKFDSKFAYEVRKESANKVIVEVEAETFVKSLFIHFKDNYKYLYSDNYLNIEAGDKASVEITSEEPIDITKIQLDAYKA